MVAATGGSTDSLAVPPLDNGAIAQALEEVAALFEAKDSNPFRVRAYRKAARTIRALERPLQEVVASDGIEGLTRLEGIGKSIANTVEQTLRTGKMSLLDRLRARSADNSILTTVPGLGTKLASRIVSDLGIKNLFDLESAAHDGRLAALPGIGRKRLRAVQESLAGRLGHALRKYSSRGSQPEVAQDVWRPPVSELLSLDAEYRRQAEQGRLLQISPRRFNPTGKRWLPILHVRRDDRCYTALYSNSPRAHELGMTRDWVVIYRNGAAQTDQWTVITCKRGRLRGRRIIRGREAECELFYAQRAEINAHDANAEASASLRPPQASSKLAAAPDRITRPSSARWRQKSLFPGA